MANAMPVAKRSSNCAEIGIVSRLLAGDPISLSVPNIAEILSKLAGTNRSKVMRICVGLLHNPEKLTDTNDRIRTAKLAVALLPETSGIIEDCMSGSGTASAELRFTLFCYLDDARLLTAAKDFLTTVPAMVGNFLLNARSDTARAAWMAGDFLGDHWPLHSSLPLLLTLVEKGRFVAGRVAAIHGLARAYSHARTFDKQRIRERLIAVARTDKSHTVRRHASTALDTEKHFREEPMHL